MGLLVYNSLLICLSLTPPSLDVITPKYIFCGFPIGLYKIWSLTVNSSITSKLYTFASTSHNSFLISYFPCTSSHVNCQPIRALSFVTCIRSRPIRVQDFHIKYFQRHPPLVFFSTDVMEVITILKYWFLYFYISIYCFVLNFVCLSALN